MNIENLPLKILNKEKEESYRNKNHIKGKPKKPLLERRKL